MIKNGGGGLVLVLLILFLFLSGRVAFWVAVGIPVSFMATLAVMSLVFILIAAWIFRWSTD